MITIGEILSEKKKIQEAEKQYKKDKVKEKNYLSQQDREEIIILAAICSKLEELVELWLRYNRPRQRIKCGKMALTYTYKAMDSYFEIFKDEKELKKEVEKTVKDVQRYEIVIDKKY